MQHLESAIPPRASGGLIDCFPPTLYDSGPSKPSIANQRVIYRVDTSETIDANLPAFLASHGPGRSLVHFKPGCPLFLQGESAQNLFYLCSGNVRLTVVSANGKECTIALLSRRDFAGEEALVAKAVRSATAMAIVPCSAVCIERAEMNRAMRQETSVADLFLRFLLTRSLRTQADLVDQLFNSSEKRLARILLLLAKPDRAADLGQEELLHSLGDQPVPIPKISQEVLAGMIGTTRSRVSYFMNRFRERGFIDYDTDIRVHKSLVTVLRHE